MTLGCVAAALAWPVVATVRVGLWILPGALVRGVVDRAAQPPVRARRAGFDPGPIAAAVARASKVVPRASCLTQALAAQALYVAAGAPGTILLGVARDGDTLHAHAWLEHSGRVVLGDGAPADYTVLGPLGGRQARGQA